MSGSARSQRLAAALLTALALAPAAASARVVVVGLDGASWNVIDPMLEAGELPSFRALISQGRTAALRTVEPVISPVVWTSIATGRSPEAHGITDFFRTAAHVKTPTIYERLAMAGVAVGLYDVLVTWPPAPLPKGFVVPGWLRRDDTTWPSDALARAGDPIFRTVYQGTPGNRDYLAQAQQELREKVASWRALDRAFSPQLSALTFYAIDAVSHRYWHGWEPGAYEGEPLTKLADDEKTALRDAMLGIDRALGEIRGTLSARDTLLLVSDHGFQASPDGSDVWVTRLEDTLAREGIEPEHDGFRIVSTFGAVTIRIAPGPVDLRDRAIGKLRRLLESYESSEGEPLFRVARVDVAPRPAGSERGLLDRLTQWGVVRVARWAFAIEVDPTAQAMIFALPRTGTLEALWPTGHVRVNGRTLELSQAIQRQRFTGTHDPQAVLIASGGPIAPRADRDDVSVLDVAPLIAYLSEQPIPDDLEGELPEGWIEAPYLAAHPPRRVAAERLPGVDRRAEDADAAQDPALTERLRALGYLE